MVLVMRGNDVVITESYFKATPMRRRFAASALRNLVVFSILMMVVPVTTYFAARNFYTVHFAIGDAEHWSPEHIGAMAAVVAVHILLGLFVYVAFTEDVSDEAEGDDAIINLKNRIKQMEKAVAEAEAEKQAPDDDAAAERSNNENNADAVAEELVEDVQSPATETPLEAKKEQ